MTQVQPHAEGNATLLPTIPSNQNSSDEVIRRQFELAEKFGVHSVDTGTKSFFDGDTHINIDRSATNSSLRIELAPGEGFMCDRSIRAVRVDDGIKVRPGISIWLNPWKAMSRKLGGEKAMLRTYWNKSNKPQVVTLKVRGSSLVAVDPSKAGGAIKCEKGAFVGSIVGADKKRTEPGFIFKSSLWRPFGNTLVGGDAIKQKIKGPRYTFLAADGGISIEEIPKGTNVDQNGYLLYSMGVGRGFGWKFNPLTSYFQKEKMWFERMIPIRRKGPSYIISKVEDDDPELASVEVIKAPEVKPV